jgi:hypothetical protein
MTVSVTILTAVRMPVIVTEDQRLFNCIDDNALINQLLAPLEVGQEVDTAAKAHSFGNLLVLPALGRNFLSVHRKHFTDLILILFKCT